MAMVMAIAGCTSMDQTGKAATTTASPAPSSKDDATAKMVRCLTEKGWEVKVGEDGRSYEYSLPSSQRSQFQVDEKDCRHEFGLDVLPPITQQYAEHAYDVYLRAAECVRGLGHQVSDPPSKQAFVEELMRRRIASWHPYDEVMKSDPNLHGQLERECPIDMP